MFKFVQKATIEKIDRFSLKTQKPVEKEHVSEFDAVKMLRDVDPKEYEKYANHFGVKVSKNTIFADILI